MDMKTRHPTLGSLLRGLRARNGWTLKEMSEESDGDSENEKKKT